MAEFYTTTGISHHLEEIIKNAEERLWLISPYLKVNNRLKELLEEVLLQNVAVGLYCLGTAPPIRLLYVPLMRFHMPP